MPALFAAVILVGCIRGEWDMLKRGIPVNAIGYQNQTLNEDGFSSTIREIERGRNLGGSAGQFELTKINKSI